MIVMRAAPFNATLSLAVALILALSACSSRRPMSAPWCAVVADRSNLYCEYETLRECNTAISGVGGTCVQNPRLGRPQEEAPTSRRQR